MVDYTSYAEQAAQKYGISTSYLNAMVTMEGTPNNLFGFQGGAAQKYGFSSQSDFLDIGKQFDAGAAYAKQNASQLGAKLGRAPTDFETYLAHWQGASGSYNILSNPNAKAEDTVQNYWKNGGTSLPIGATNQDWVNKAKDRWLKAGGSLSETDVGATGAAASLTGVGGGGAIAAGAGGGADVGWGDYIVHQGVRAGVFTLGIVLIGMGVIVFTVGGGVRGNVQVYREFRRGREIAQAGAAKVDVRAEGGSAKGGTVFVSSRRTGRKRGGGSAGAPVTGPKPPKPPKVTQANVNAGAKPAGGSKSMRMLRDVVKKRRAAKA